MTPILHQRPEPVCETLALLYIAENLEDLIRLMAKLLNTGQGDFASYYHMHEALHRKYVAAFRERAVYPGEWKAFFFHQMSAGEYVLMALPFLMDQNLIFDAESRGEAELKALLREAYRFLYDSGMSGFTRNEQAQELDAYLAGGAGGEAMREVAEHPASYLLELARAVRENIPAMEDAWMLVREQAQAFIASSWRSVDEFYEKGLVKRDAPIRHIYPQLSLYTTSFFIGDAYYYGLFNVDERPEEIRSDEKRFLTDVCKALGDTTRMEILLLLRERPWYNRELAQTLDLTPATIMHHMDILLQNGLAVMTTDRENQKRIYFSLVPERLEKLRETLGRLFQ